MDRAVANLQAFTGAPLEDAIHAASRSPARMLGMDALGGITIGQPASFNIFNAEGKLVQTILRGREVNS
jgi:N-acetylglucosamine-6-phosphate deacetylase